MSASLKSVLKKMKNKGFTLIELLLYLSLSGIFLLGAMSFSLQIMRLYGLSGNFHEISSNGEFIMETLQTSIQNAEEIHLVGSTFDNDNGVLSLNMANTAESPTTFSLVSGNLIMQKGITTPIQLNTLSTEFTFLRFHRVSYAKAPDQIIIDGEMQAKTADLAKTQRVFPLHLSVSLRKL